MCQRVHTGESYNFYFGIFISCGPLTDSINRSQQSPPSPVSATWTVSLTLGSCFLFSSTSVGSRRISWEIHTCTWYQRTHWSANVIRVRLAGHKPRINSSSVHPISDPYAIPLQLPWGRESRDRLRNSVDLLWSAGHYCGRWGGGGAQVCPHVVEDLI